MNAIKKFNHPQFGDIRCMVDGKGEPWFVGKDVAEKLGYAKPQNAIATHVAEEDKTTALIQGTGSNYKSQCVIINESGLYALILASKLPKAKAFKHWVTSEVLPQIRKTGGYINVNVNDNDNSILLKALKIYEKTCEIKDEIIDGLMDKAQYYDKVLSSPSTYTMTELAKELSMTVHELQERLIDLHVIYRAPSGVFMLYAEHLKQGYEAYRTYGNKDIFGNVESTRTYLVWTEKGKAFIHNLLS